jgi:two-component system response regulator AtoC
LDLALKSGKFRDDLFYRLNVIPVFLPPLRERKMDIPLLIQFFINKYRRSTGKPGINFDDQAMDALVAYNWPGNVRELENVIQRAVVMARKNIITIGNLGAEPSAQNIRSYLAKELGSGLNFKEIISKIEKELIQAVLREKHWNRTKAADKLQIHRRLLYSKMKEYNL